MTEKTGFRTVAYYVNWAIYARNYQPQSLPAFLLTHALYSFANVRPETGEVYLTDSWSDTDKHYPTDSWNDPGTNLYGCLKQLNILKRKNRNFKLLLSVGGWTYSSNFAAPMATDAGRKTFASSCVQLIKDCGFDGIDIDWEYPANDAQAADFVTLLSEVRAAMGAYATSQNLHPDRFLLTVACPAGPTNFQKLHVAAMDQHLSFWNLMAYDYAGSWDANAGHQANVYPSGADPVSTPFSTKAAVDFYCGQGVHPSKIVMGCPLYGRAFENTDGPGRPFSGVGEGSWENGVWDYKALPRPGSQVMYDDKSVASWCYDAGKKTMVSYDSPECADAKTNWVRQNGFGGVMWWESSGDVEGEQGLMPRAQKLLAQNDGMEVWMNVVDYPESKYDNLRSGFPGEV